MGINVTLVDRIAIEWRGKFWCRKPVITIHFSKVFGTAQEPQEIEAVDGSVTTLTGADSGKLGFVIEPPATPGDKA